MANGSIHAYDRTMLPVARCCHARGALVFVAALLIVPGGDFIVMGDSLTAHTRTALHDAVQDGRAS